MNFRVLDLRTPANQGIFRVQCQVENVSPHLVVNPIIYIHLFVVILEIVVIWHGFGKVFVACEIKVLCHVDKMGWDLVW